MTPVIPTCKHAFCERRHSERAFPSRPPIALRPVLFDPRAHEPLLEAEWSPAAVEAAIRRIARDADEAMREDDWWPVHPLDVEGETPDVIHGVYLGAAGVLWALDRLARAGLHEPGRDYGRLAARRPGQLPAAARVRRPAPSLWIGEGGIALVAWLLAPSHALADRLAGIVAPSRTPTRSK